MLSAGRMYNKPANKKYQKNNTFSPAINSSNLKKSEMEKKKKCKHE